MSPSPRILIFSLEGAELTKNSLFDTYAMRARVWPFYLAITPLAFLFLALYPGYEGLISGAFLASVLLPFAFLANQISADRGKSLEPGLWADWGGPPTIQFLRHTNYEFDKGTKTRLHERLRELGCPVPTEEQEQSDSPGADQVYESCTKLAIRSTRETNRFRLVHLGLTEYGFRRNMLGLKPLGMSLSAVACVGAGMKAWLELEGAQELGEGLRISAQTMVAGVLCTALLVVWFFVVKRSWVRPAAERYARFLLEAVLTLDD